MQTGTTMRASRALVIASAFATLAAAPGVALSETTEGYVTNADGEVYRNADGDCWHSPEWSEELAIEECEPDLVAQAQEEAEVAAVEEPAAAEPEPAAKTLEQVTLNEDIWFDFDEASLSADMQSALDQLIGEAEAAEQVLDVRLVGHADRIGPQAYNERLAKRRAQTVEEYLRRNAGKVAQTEVTTESKGEQTSIVECGDKQGQALIQCLQPDRRVDIELSAERLTTR